MKRKNNSMMKKTYWIFAILSFVSFTLQAQNTFKKWSLEECINYAIQNNINIKQKEIQRQDAEIRVNTAKMSRLPDLNAGMGQNWSFGRSNNNETGIYENQQTSNSRLNIQSSTPIFTGFRINNEIKKTKLDLEAATYSLSKAKEDMSINVASLYLQVLFNKEILRVNEEQLQLSKDQVKRTEQLVDVGKSPLSQLYDIKAQVAKDEVNVTQAKNNLQLALLDLAQSLELQSVTNFDVVEPNITNVVENNMQSIIHPDNIYKNAITFKPAIKEQEILLESSKADLNIAQSGYYPKLNLDLSYNNGYFYNYSMEGKELSNGEVYHNPSFSDQFKDNAGEVIGLSLSIPIFNRFQVRNQVKSARLNIQNQQLNLDNTKKALYKEIQTAYYNATGAQDKYISSEKAVDASQLSFKYAQERYEAGKSTVFEFNEAKTKLVQSQSEQIQAKYEYIFRTKILDFYNGMKITL